MKTKDQRVAEATERNNKWSKLSSEEKKKLLANRPGNCKRQLSRLNEKS